MFSADPTIIVFIHVNKPQLNPNFHSIPIQSNFPKCCWKTKPIATITINPNMCHPKPTLLSPQPDMVEPFMIFKFYARSPNYKLWATYSVGACLCMAESEHVKLRNVTFTQQIEPHPSQQKMNVWNDKGASVLETLHVLLCWNSWNLPTAAIKISQQQHSNQEHRSHLICSLCSTGHEYCFVEGLKFLSDPGTPVHFFLLLLHLSVRKIL